MTSRRETVNTVTAFTERLRAARVAHRLPPGLRTVAEQAGQAVLAHLFPHYAPGPSPAIALPLLVGVPAPPGSPGEPS